MEDLRVGPVRRKVLDYHTILKTSGTLSRIELKYFSSKLRVTPFVLAVRCGGAGFVARIAVRSVASENRNNIN